MQLRVLFSDDNGKLISYLDFVAVKHPTIYYSKIMLYTVILNLNGLVKFWKGNSVASELRCKLLLSLTAS
jgi:hypothetical protein